MKAFHFSTACTFAFLFFFSLSVNAQWQINGTNINNTNSGKVGIGLGNAGLPSYKLHVVGDRIRLAHNSSTTAKTIDMRTDGVAVDITANNANLFLGSSTGNTIIQGFGRKVGIGTDAPAAELHVNGSENNGSTTSALKIANGTDAMLFDGNEIEGASGQSLYLQNHHSGNLYLVNGGGRVTIGGNIAGNNKLLVKGFENDGTASSVKIVSGTQVMLMDGNEIDALTDALYLNHNSSQNVFMGTGGGNVRIGSWVNPTSKLDVGGDVRCFNIFTNSDRRYKTGIKTLESALDKVLAMRGTSYDFAADQLPEDYTAGKQVGFIAQEMQAVMPELVKTDAEGMMSVNYIGVIPVLVEALKEQNTVIEEKETRIAALEAKNNELQDRLARIETALGIATTERQEAPAAITASISPNPTAGIVTVSLNNTASAKSVIVKVLDSTGREIANRNADGTSSVQFDLSQFPAGVYVAQVVADGKMVSANKVQLVK
jgi:hypothetical protein